MGPAEELVRIAKKLDKMVARKSTTTRIGVAVNSVRKHCSDEEVVASAKILIKNWKRLLESSTTPKKEKDVDGKKEKDTDGEKEKKEKGLDFPSCPNEGAKHPKSSAEKHREKHKERKPSKSGSRAVTPRGHPADSISERESGDGRSPTASSKKSPLDGKKERRDSADSRSSTTSAVSSSSSPQKRPSAERRASVGTSPSPAPTGSRRNSSDSKEERANSSKAKPETPRTPTSPPFSPSPCLLAPCYLTGDSVRDKCIEMLTAALRMDDDYKEFGVNCEKMASEIEDHILWGGWESPGSVCWGTHTWAQEQWWGQDRGWWGQGQRVAGTRTEGGRDKDRVTDGLCCPCCLQREPRPWLEADAEQSIPMAPALVQGSVCAPSNPSVQGPAFIPVEIKRKPSQSLFFEPAVGARVSCQPWSFAVPGLCHTGRDGATSVHSQLKAWGSPGSPPRLGPAPRWFLLLGML
uniref:Transcription elongation factor A3 n=1 Tax=Aquila chrysaetos chrysaetos TaxID=223781 RepID=A0A663EV53_AQUCH